MGFKPAAFGILSGDKPADIVKNAGLDSTIVGGYAAKQLKQPEEEQPAAKRGGQVKSSASSRADGIAQRGKTRGKMY